MTQDEQKQAVAREAIKYVVDDAMIGVGSGSTANLFIDELAKIKHRIKGTVASSVKSAERLKGHGIYVDDLNNVSDIPVYIDGADEVTERGAMIKGGGGALTREKIVACGRAEVRLHRRRVEAGRRARQVPAAGRGDPDGEELRRAAARAARRPAGVANGIHHRQRQRHPRRAQPVDRQSRRDGRRRSAQSSASSPWDSSRRAEPT
jgi:hypothetical protein